MLKNLSISNSKFPKAFVFCVCLLITLEASISIFFVENNPDLIALDKLLHRNSKDVDFLFLGSSRIRSNIHKETLDKIKRLEFVNFGFGGAHAAPLYFVLNRFLNHNPGMQIRHCILGLDKQHLVDIYSTRFREGYVTTVLTFREFCEIKKYLPEQMKKDYYLSKIIPSYRPPDSFLVYNIYKNNVYKYPGYETRMNRYNNITSEHLAFQDLLELNMKYTEKIIELCLSNDIHVQLLINPLPQSIYEEHLLLNPHSFKEMDDFIDHLCEKYGVELIKLPIVLPDNKFQDPSYRAHPTHLNRNGAIDYTELLVDKIIHNK